MKKSILAATMAVAMASQSAQAFIITGGTLERGSVHDDCYTSGNTTGWSGSCLVTSTAVSLPTLIVEGTEVDFSAEDTQAQLIAEASENAEPILVSAIAEKLQARNDKVSAAILGLHATGQAITIESIAEALR